ncbi:TetR/AcrR family transcriptional regulator [Thalassotalea litorea]|uniref:TetR/AcrR family transcriptional regulator n=1 Tax=Thalassotalea litorea TaxID=2020715 RepID=UPI003736774A
MQQSKRQIMAQQKYQAIIKAATKLFAEKGFHGTTVPEVAKQAGIGAGTIYLYFQNKEDLVNGVFQESKSKLKLYLARDIKIDQSQDLQQAFNVAWQNLCDFASENPQDFCFLELHEHSKYLNRESKRIEISILAPLRMIILQGKKQSKIKPLPAITLIAMIWGVFVGLFKANLHGYAKLNQSTLTSARDMCWDMISP